MLSPSCSEDYVVVIFMAVSCNMVDFGRTSQRSHVGRPTIDVKHGQPILFSGVADVTFAPAIKRGDAGYFGGPAALLAIQKQPAAGTIGLTEQKLVGLVGYGISLTPLILALRCRRTTRVDAHSSVAKILGAGLPLIRGPDTFTSSYAVAALIGI